MIKIIKFALKIYNNDKLSKKIKCKKINSNSICNK